MVSDDVILKRIEFTYDSAGDVVSMVVRRRYHNAPDSQTGPLEDPATTPKARVSYVASYPNALGRVIATADYGTNDGTALSRLATVPVRSDNALVTTTVYNSRGKVQIENSRQWSLDVTYREDESRIRNEHFRESFA